MQQPHQPVGAEAEHADEGDPRPDIDKLMTNRFSGAIKLSAGEWSLAEKNAQEFRPFVS